MPEKPTPRPQSGGPTPADLEQLATIRLWQIPSSVLHRILNPLSQIVSDTTQPQEVRDLCVQAVEGIYAVLSERRDRRRAQREAAGLDPDFGEEQED